MNKIKTEHEILLYALRYAFEQDTEKIEYVLDVLKENIGKFTINQINLLNADLEYYKYYEMKPVIKNNEDSETYVDIPDKILLYALCYALGRMTYAVSTVAQSIQINIPKISPEVLEEMRYRIDTARSYGMEMDKQVWMRLRSQL